MDPLTTMSELGTRHPRPGAAFRLTGLDRVTPLLDGDPSVLVAVLDGPVRADHPGFAPGAVRTTADAPAIADEAVAHGTMVTGLLAARRDSDVYGLCPGCRILVRPIFAGANLGAHPDTVADALVECVDRDARLMNISGAFGTSSRVANTRLVRALDYAATRGAIVVVAAGNDGRVGGSSLISHPWVVPVASCDERGRPIGNLGASIGRRGVLAPGFGIETLTPDGRIGTVSGSSAATVLVTAALALTWSAAPQLSGGVLRSKLLVGPRRSIVPPLLDAWELYKSVAQVEVSS